MQETAFSVVGGSLRCCGCGSQSLKFSNGTWALGVRAVDISCERCGNEEKQHIAKYPKRVIRRDSGFWVVEALPHRGELADDVYPTHDHASLVAVTRNMAFLEETGEIDNPVEKDIPESFTYRQMMECHLKNVRKRLSVLG